MEPIDLLVRAHSHAGTTTLAARSGRIVHIGANEELPGPVTPGTATIDTDGVMMPGFIDTHNHLMLAARNQLGAPVATASSIGELLQRIRARAGTTETGQWVVTGADWHERSLAEQRLPTRVELDGATTEHPVLLQRGGHLGVLNTAGLRASGLASPGVVERGVQRDTDGKPTGRVEDEALHAVLARLPPHDPDALGDALAETSSSYAADGLVAVRDPAVTPAEWQVYRQVHAAGRLAVRSRVMMFTTRAAVAGAGSATAYLDELEQQGIRPGIGDAMLDVWGIKLVLDGGVEAAALSHDYRGQPGYRGGLLWDRGELGDILAAAAARGWPVGMHAFGDRAVALALTALDDVVAQHGGLPAGGFVLEHGGLVDAAQRQALVRLGVHLTAQQALLDALAPALLDTWGHRRTAALFPWRALVDDGVDVSAGTDHPIGPLSPLRAVHGMTTRIARAGALGTEHAITRAEALTLSTTAGAPILGGGLTGELTPGDPADLTLYSADPATCPIEQVPDLEVRATVVAGHLVHTS